MLDKKYNAKTVETGKYEFWKEKNYFKSGDLNKEPYCIVIPPPNVTGKLHLGHAWDTAIQDIIVRYKRMCGYDVLWLPGTDHAAIATEVKVINRIKERGQDKYKLGREKFLDECFKWKDEHEEIIHAQWAKLGLSVDYEKERFTMDEGMSLAVKKVFVDLYEKGLIYRGEKIINWDPQSQTALSNEEVIYKEVPGAFYHIKYYLEGSDKFLRVATTRPETLFGDTAVAVNPYDDRYKAIVGKKLKLPITGKEIPIIADDYVDMEFGTGMVKITPAHDPNDWEVGLRHNLEVINLLTPDGRMNENVPEKYRGLKPEQARALVIEDLTAAGLFKEEEKMDHAVGKCYRCKTVVEPYLSDQWFVKMKPLAEKALESWRKGELVFYPKKWENTYSHWMENIRDWCVSRQIWWGHRIPVWYCKKCGEVIVSREDPKKCPKCGCGAEDLEQDPDVLDTWFSSWLWPFSTLGWPQQTEDLAKFYPTQALLTAYDIIPFWVCRMIMAGLEFTGKAPFHDIYIHGLVRDKQGRKMSKSLGNGMDPLEIIDMYGADALKFTLGFMCAQGQDILIDKDSFKLGSRFCNKVWNASRYLLGNLEGRNLVPVKDADLTELDKWIYGRLNFATKTAREALESYRYNDAASAMMEFFWNEFCDWYVEATKINFKNGDDKEKDRQASVLMNILEESLRLLHPYLPFVTEEIYAKLPLKEIAQARNAAGENKIVSMSEYTGMLINAPYPEVAAERNNAAIDARFEALKELITKTRALRVECGIDPAEKINIAILVTKGSEAEVCKEKVEMIQLLAGIKNIDFVESKPESSIGTVGKGFESFIIVDETINKEQLLARFKKTLEKEQSYARMSQNKLNGNFAQHAPAELVEKEKQLLEETNRKIEKLQSYIQSL